MSNTNENATVPTSRAAALDARVLLISPRVGCWEGRYRIPRALVDLTVGGIKMDAATAPKHGVTTPHTVLLTDTWPVDQHGKAWKKRFAEAQAIKERALSAYSIPFSVAGARIVPMTKGRAFFDAMVGLTFGELRRIVDRAIADGANPTTFREKITRALDRHPGATDTTPIYDERRDGQSFAYTWAELATEFSNSVADVYEQIREHLANRDVWLAIAPRLPKGKEEMRAKFYCDLLPVELADRQGTTTRVTSVELSAYEDTMRTACSRAVESAIESLIERPRQELAEVLANLQELIDRDGRVTARSFRPAQEALEKLRAFQFVANADLLRAMDALEQRLDTTPPTSLNAATAAANGFSEALRAARDAVEDADMMARDIAEFGRPTRALAV